MSRMTKSYASELARRSPSSPSVIRSTAHRCSSSPRFTYWPTVGSSSMTRIRIGLLDSAGSPKAVLANLSIESLRADAERRRSAPLVPARLVQHGLDVPSLELGQGDRGGRGAIDAAGYRQGEWGGRGGGLRALRGGDGAPDHRPRPPRGARPRGAPQARP